ncbi:MAG TPA: peroxiredoxin [Candidatus Binatia bacterium]|nr:peroxiredoxin [Candidatus Binatia bacterium]
MLDLNAEAPAFALDGVVNGAVRRVTLAEFRGRWLVLFFYPADWSFVCPTEVVGFERRLGDLTRLGAAVVGVSVDDVESHRAWAAELGGVTYPLLADPTRAVCRAYGVLNEAEGRAYRATIVVSPEGRIAYQVVSPMNVGRSVEETVRVLEALRSGKLCPADWKPGDPTLDARAGD